MANNPFIMSAKLHPPQSPVIWIGPFADKDDAADAIETARKSGFDIVVDEEIPQNIQTGIFAQIMTNSAAKRKGLKFGTDEDNWVGTFDEAYKDVPRVEPIPASEDNWDDEPSKMMPEESDEPDFVEVQEKKKRGRPKGVTVQKVTSKPQPKPEVKRESFPKQGNNLGQYIQGEVVIVAQNTGVIEWLLKRGIRGELISRVNHPSQIEGKTVIGVLPIWLISHASANGIINMPRLTPQQRDAQYLSPDEMDRAEARIDWYGPPPFLGSTK